MRLASWSQGSAEAQRKNALAGTQSCPTPKCFRNPGPERVGHHNFPLATPHAKPKASSPVGPNFPGHASVYTHSLAARDLTKEVQR